MPFACDPFVAQPRLRQKCVKLNYQIAFWTIVAMHQYFAFGFLQRWRISRADLGCRLLQLAPRPGFRAEHVCANRANDRRPPHVRWFDPGSELQRGGERSRRGRSQRLERRLVPDGGVRPRPDWQYRSAAQRRRSYNEGACRLINGALFHFCRYNGTGVQR